MKAGCLASFGCGGWQQQNNLTKVSQLKKSLTHCYFPLVFQIPCEDRWGWSHKHLVMLGLAWGSKCRSSQGMTGGFWKTRVTKDSRSNPTVDGSLEIRDQLTSWGKGSLFLYFSNFYTSPGACLGFRPSTVSKGLLRYKKRPKLRGKSSIVFDFQERNVERHLQANTC